MTPPSAQPEPFDSGSSSARTYAQDKLRGAAGLAQSKALAFALASLVTGLIIWGCLFKPPSPGEAEIPHLDKAKHAGAYLLFALTWARALALSGRTPAFASLAALALGATQGGVIELIQPRFGRTCDIFDEVANIAGAIVGALLFKRFLALTLACSLGVLACGGCSSPEPRTVTVVTVPGRSAGISPEDQTRGERELAAKRAGHAPAAQGAPLEPDSPTGGAIPLPPDEDARLVEQAQVRRMSGEALAREFYDVLLARVVPRDRPFFRWLRARLEPSREERRAAIARSMGFTVRIHGALLDLGDMAFEDGRLAEARTLWLEAHLVDPRSPRTLARRAFFEPGAAGVAASLEAVKAYEERTTKLSDPFVARCHERTSREARGAALLALAEEQGISPAIAARFRGEALLAANDPVGASRAFERALLFAPIALIPPEAYRDATLARALRLTGERNPIAAEELVLSAALREAPGAPPLFRYAAAVAALASGDAATAAERARDAAALDLPGAPLGMLAAELLARAGRPDAARLLLSPGGPSR